MLRRDFLKLCGGAVALLKREPKHIKGSPLKFNGVDIEPVRHVVVQMKTAPGVSVARGDWVSINRKGHVYPCRRNRNLFGIATEDSISVGYGLRTVEVWIG